MPIVCHACPQQIAPPEQPHDVEYNHRWLSLVLRLLLTEEQIKEGKISVGGDESDLGNGRKLREEVKDQDQGHHGHHDEEGIGDEIMEFLHILLDMAVEL